MCAITKNRALNIPSGERLYVIGEKPSNTMIINLTVTDGGQIYPVFTTNSLQIHGLGYILRWRTATNSGNYGSWRIPGAAWPTDNNPDMPGQPWFYQGYFNHTTCFGSSFGSIPNGFTSFQEWTATVTASPGGCFYSAYGVELEFHYVMIQNAANSQLDSSTQTVTTDIAVFKARPQGSNPLKGTVKHTVTIHHPPWGT